MVLVVKLEHRLRELAFTTFALAERYPLLIISIRPTTSWIFVVVVIKTFVNLTTQRVDVERYTRPFSVSCTVRNYLVRLIIV